MTDLLSRPTEDSRSDGTSEDAVPRPLAVGAAVAGAAASVGSLLACMTVCVIGWFLADAGAHGQTTDALRVGADVWLVGHGSGLIVAGTPFHVIPLALTALFAVVAWRTGRWAAASSAAPEDDRAMVLAGVVQAGVYVVVTVLTCILAADTTAQPNFGRAIAGALVMSLVGALGLASGAGTLAAWIDRFPGWVRAMVHGALRGFAVLVAAAAVLLVVRLAMGLSEAASVLSALRLRPGDYVMFVVAVLCVLPNAVLLSAAYLLGPGFTVGTGTVVSPGLVALGPLPAFPLFAALPEDGPTPSWAVALVATPVLAGITGAVLAQRAYRVTAYDSAALRGFGSGLGAALLVTIAVALSGGPIGTGRMADLGAPVGGVLVVAMGAMSLGGLVGGVVTAFCQRRGEPVEQAPTTIEVELDRSPDRHQRAPEKVHELGEKQADDWEDTIEVPILGGQQPEH